MVESVTKERRVRVRNGAVSICMGLLTVEVYWPQLFFMVRDYKPTYGIMLKTCALYIPAKNWAWDYSLCFMVLGFGIGGAWNHVENPSHVARSEP